MKIIKSLSILGFLVLGGTSNQALADNFYYSFHPMSTMSLGGGFSPNQLSLVKAPCVHFTPRPAEGGALDTRFRVDLVSNHQELKEVLGLDVNIDASYLIFRGSSQNNYRHENLFTRDRVTVVIRAVSEFGRLVMNDPVLLPHAQELITNNHHAEFERVCGSQVVAMERRGASVSAIISIEGLSETDKSSITSNNSVTAGVGPLSGTARVNFQHQLERANREQRIDVQIVATGGAGLGSLADIVRGCTAADNSLERIQTALGEFVRSFTAANAVPIGFHSISMEMFGWNPAQESLWDQLKQSRLIEITDSYRQTAEDLASIEGLLDPVNNRSTRRLLTDENIHTLQQARPLFQARLAALAQAHRNCQTQAQSDCTLPAEPAIPDMRQLPVPALRVLMEWQSYPRYLASTPGHLLELSVEGVHLTSLVLRYGGRVIKEVRPDQPAQNLEFAIEDSDLTGVYIDDPGVWTLEAKDTFGRRFQVLNRCGMTPVSSINRGLRYFNCEPLNGRRVSWIRAVEQR